MDQTMAAALTAIGMDVQATVARFGGNERLLLKYLRRFPADPSYATLQAAMVQDDPAAQQSACHTLKGISGTLGLSALYTAVSAMMAALRENDEVSARHHFEAVQQAYRQALTLVENLGE